MERERGLVMTEIKVLIVDDHAVVRDGLTTMLDRQEDLSVVGEAANGLEAIDKAGLLRPDVVLMDLRMPELDGVEAMSRIRAEDADVEFIVLTTYDSDEYIFDAIEAGAKGYLLKDVSREELFQAVRAVNRGESLIQPSVTAKVLDRFAQLSRQVTDVEVLSERDTGNPARFKRGRQQRDRGRAVHQREHGENSCRQHLPETGGKRPHGRGDTGAAKGNHQAIALLKYY